MFFVPGPYPPHVFGSTCFHGNIEDEWLVVHLLFALSRAQQQLVIRLVTSPCRPSALYSFLIMVKWFYALTARYQIFL